MYNRKIMIVVNLKSGKRFQTDNKSLVARTINYHRNSVDRWAKRYKKKDAKDMYRKIAFTVYFDEELYKKEN